MKHFYWSPVVALLCIALSGHAAQADEGVAKLKDPFLAKQKALIAESPAELNEGYLKHVTKLQATAKAKGDLDYTLALEAEIKSIETTGSPAAEVSAEEFPGLKDLREIYRAEYQKFFDQKVTRYRDLVTAYRGDLQGKMTELTKANLIDEAIVFHEELTRVENFLENKGGNHRDFWTPGVPSKGKLRAVGVVRKSGKPWGGLMIHKEVFSKYDDLVEIGGNIDGIMVVRSNGDAIDETGTVYPLDIVSLQTPYGKFGGVDSKGNFHEFHGSFAKNDSTRILQATGGWQRDLSVTKDGNLVWSGHKYRVGERILPPMETREKVKQVGAEGDFDYVLKESGEIMRWNHKSLDQNLPGVLRSEVKLMAFGRYRAWFLMADGKVRNQWGQQPKEVPNKAKYVASGGGLMAILGEDEQWRVNASEKTLGNELELLEAVLNHPATVDVAFFLHNAVKNDDSTTAYVAWIEDPSIDAVPIQVGTTLEDAVTSSEPIELTGETEKTRRSSSGVTFFGIPID